MSYPELEILYSGAKFKICAIKEGDKCTVKEFISSLKESDQKRIVALLKFTAEYGPPKNEEKFKKLNGVDIYEFKSYQTRIFAFFEKGQIIILTNAFPKKQDKTPKAEITKANEVLKLFKKKG